LIAIIFITYTNTNDTTHIPSTTIITYYRDWFYKIRIDSLYNNSIFIRNVGTLNASISDLTVYVDDIPVNCSWSYTNGTIIKITDEILPVALAECNVSSSIKNCSIIKVVYPSGEDRMGC
jgi:hypothetical protein